MNERQNYRVHIRVEGRVQGVGFRYFVIGEAGNLGLTGWVRNRLDGSVEVIAEGERDKLIQLVHVLQRGSRSSVVSAVREEWLEGTGEFQGFSVRDTR